MDSDRIAPGRILSRVAIGSATFGLAHLALLLTSRAEGVACIWMANAVLIAALLLSPRRSWPARLGVGLASLLAANALAGLPWGSGWASARRASWNAIWPPCWSGGPAPGR